jgi:hypothetical protein
MSTSALAIKGDARLFRFEGNLINARPLYPDQGAKLLFWIN